MATARAVARPPAKPAPVRQPPARTAARAAPQPPQLRAAPPIVVPPAPPRTIIYALPPEAPKAHPGPVMPTGWLVVATVVGTLVPIALAVLAMTGHSQLDQATPAVDGARGLYIAALALGAASLGFGILLAVRWRAPLAWFGLLLGAAIYLVADSDLRSYGPFYSRGTATLILAILAAILVAALTPTLNSLRRGPHPASAPAGILIAYGAGFVATMTVLVARIQQEAHNAQQANQDLPAPGIALVLAALAMAGLLRQRLK